jgi:hypothetical protein
MEESIRRTIAIQKEINNEGKNKNSIASLMMSLAMSADDEQNKENESSNNI